MPNEGADEGAEGTGEVQIAPRRDLHFPAMRSAIASIR